MPTEKEYTDSSYCICWASIHTNANEIAQSGPAALLLLEFENDDFFFRHSIQKRRSIGQLLRAHD